MPNRPTFRYLARRLLRGFAKPLPFPVPGKTIWVAPPGTDPDVACLECVDLQAMAPGQSLTFTEVPAGDGATVRVVTGHGAGTTVASLTRPVDGAFAGMLVRAALTGRVVVVCEGKPGVADTLRAAARASGLAVATYLPG